MLLLQPGQRTVAATQERHLPNLACFLPDSPTAQHLDQLPETHRNLLPEKLDELEASTLYTYRQGANLLLVTRLPKTEELKPEAFRKLLHGTLQTANGLKLKQLHLQTPGLEQYPKAELLAEALGEIPLLSLYTYTPFRTAELEKYSLNLKEITLDTPLEEAAVERGFRTAVGTVVARDLVNEAPNTLTATGLGQRALDLGKQYGFQTEVLNKAQIEELKMGGLLAVNRGSQEPPTFIILEHKPANAVNSQPVVLVGKGVVFDTGGVSLKPTANSMDYMKADMAGSAAVVGALAAAANNQTPVHVVGLIAATDNRPGENAYLPGDVITMMDGSTVEVLNTDAEGRMTLADALHYAKRYNPQLVIDLATLTGAAAVAVGEIATAMMSNAQAELKQQLLEAGDQVHERLVELPLWEEYDELLKSDIADRKNIGGRWGGAITAGKFLEHFTDYPWAHLDIAGPAYLQSPDSYRGKNGTGVGVRLLHRFLSTRS